MESIKDTPEAHPEYVVTTFGAPPEPKGSGKLVLASHVWDGNHPFGVGYPFRYVLEKTDTGVRLRNLGDSTQKVIHSPLRELTPAELSGERPIELHTDKPLWITIRPVPELEELAHQAERWVPKGLPLDPSVDPQGEKLLRRAGLGVSLISLLLLIGVWLVPARKVEEELIPPQFAKILLSPNPRTPENERSKGPAEKPEAGNVVAAFQSEAVRKTTRSLLDASAAKALLSKSSILDATKTRAALKGVFDSKSKLTGKTELKALDLKNLDRSLSAKTSRSSGGYRGDAAATAAQSGSLVAVANEGVGVAEGLTKDEVGKVIRQHLGEIRYCYESALAREPGLEGKLVVSFTVGGQGQVKEVAVKESSGSEALDQCIGARLMKWVFPKPRQGVDVGVSYPFIFKSLGG